MTLYKNKYRVESARLPSWDYAANGYYFITICTQNRECWFGSISEGKMKLSAIGGVAQKCWQDIPKHFPFVQLDAFVIMPNHIHGIIIINKPDENVSNVETQYIASLHDRHSHSPNDTQDIASLRDRHSHMSNNTQNVAHPQKHHEPASNDTQNVASLRKRHDGIVSNETQNIASLRNEPKNKFGPQSQNLASIVRGFKIGVTKFARTENIPFAWQPRFYDHIVRDEKDLNRIRPYILNNPAKWQDDKFYSRENAL